MNMKRAFLKTLIVYLFFQYLKDDEFWEIYEDFMSEKDVKLRDVWRSVREKKKKTHQHSQ